MKLMWLFMVLVVMERAHSTSVTINSPLQGKFEDFKPQQIHLAIGGKSNIESTCFIYTILHSLK